MTRQGSALRREYRDELNKLPGMHVHNRFKQRTRGYGDYLYHQDREKFEVDFSDWIRERQSPARRSR